MTKDRKEYAMTQEDWNELLEASKPVLMIMLQCGTSPSPQENINRAWGKLGDKMGFVGSTAAPSGPNTLKFTAVPK